MGAVEVDGLCPPGSGWKWPTMFAWRRIAVRGEDGGLAGALFITRNGTLPPRGWIAEQLGVDGAATEWLAGRPSTPPRSRRDCLRLPRCGRKDIESHLCQGVQRGGHR
jgi:assimilatory nitrate reductase catalytic subunit